MRIVSQEAVVCGGIGMNIAVLLGGLLYDSQKSLLSGINAYAAKNHVNVVAFTCGGDIYTVNDHNQGEFQIYRLPRLEKYDGIIIAPNTIQNQKVVKELECRLTKLQKPVISIDYDMDGHVNFQVDNVQAMYDMTAHIIEKHQKRKLLYLSGPRENPESTDRECGFCRCAKAHGLKENDDYQIRHGNFWTDSGRTAVSEYLDQHGAPHAVICANDYMAIGAVEELEKRGIRVPDDVAVTGFDNSFEGRYHVPRITSVKKEMYDIGYEACRALAEQGKRMESRRFPVQYKFSESCGCGMGKKEDIREFKRQMTKEKGDSIRWTKILNSMSADLNELNTMTEFVDKLKLYVMQMGFPYFYLCLCDEEQLIGGLRNIDGRYQIPDMKEYGNRADYSEQIRVVIAYENGQFCEPETVSVSACLPEHFWKQENGVTAIVFPVHFQLHCMGYCVVGNSSVPMETIQFQSWVMNIGNGLENIRKQMLMQAMIEQLNKMWVYDTMTGVLNRAGFYLEAKKLIDACKEKKEDVVLLFIDIDRLKTVNDTYGHEEGDFYIKAVAEICREQCGDKGIVMRYGGDEFIILCGERACGDETSMIAEIKSSIQGLQKRSKKPYLTDASIGHYRSAVSGDFKLEVLIERADKEMYAMKRSQRR